MMTPTESDNIIRRAKDGLVGPLKHFMPVMQRSVLADQLRGEERVGIAEMICRTLDVIIHLPQPYTTEGVVGALAQLHYFKGSVDAWIVECDSSDEQLQAFGKISLYGNGDEAEVGYISIKELIDNGVELDLHWKPVPLAEISG